MLNIALYFWVSNYTRQVPLISVLKVIFTYKTIPQIIEAHAYVYFVSFCKCSISHFHYFTIYI